MDDKVTRADNCDCANREDKERGCTTNGAAIQSNDRTGVKPKPMSAKLNRMGE